MKQSILILSIIALFVTSCAPLATSVPSPTLTPNPTLTPTPEIRAVLSQAATLFSGPGNVNYESLASLPAGTTVYPSGAYGDFVLVTSTVASNHLTGFVWKNALANLPASLSVLDRLQVPWEPFFSSMCSPGKYDPENDSMTFTSISADEGYFLNSADWEVTAPIRIHMKALIAKGSIWSSKSTNTEWSNFKIVGSVELSIRSRTEDGLYELDVRKISGGGDVLLAIVLPRSSSVPIQILFDQPADGKPIGSSFSVLDETGQVLKTVDLTKLSGMDLPDGMFPDGKLYFGTDTMNNSSLVVTGLDIGSQPTGQWVNQADGFDYLNGPGLSSLAEDKHLNIGTEFLADRAIDRRYCQAMEHDFNLVDLGDLTYKWFWEGEGKYAWGTVDRAVDFANEHSWRVRAYLVWGAPEAIPDWLLNSNFTRDEYISILENHIKTVMGHFKGRVQEWMIANEAVARIACDEPDSYDFWYRKIGLDYIKMAFQTAREADLQSTLIFNGAYDPSDLMPPPFDCANSTNEMMQETVMALNAGEPKLVDVVGMEMHLLTKDTKPQPQKNDVLTIMQGFVRLGVRIAITEIDVNLNFMQSKYPTQDERWQYQAGIYKDMIEACLESRACDSFTTQGISDQMSWLVTSCPGCWNDPEPSADPLMFDGNFFPKPAYFAVSDALVGTIATATPNP